MKPIVIYAKKQSNRLDYVLDFLASIFKNEIKFSNDIAFFESSNHVKINYSNQNIPHSFQIKPIDLLFEKGLKELDKATLEEDVFALTFFLLSRYEEYLTEHRDQHGRFQSKQSYLYTINKLNVPYLDIKLEQFKTGLKQAFPDVMFRDNVYKKQITVDIDQAYMYRNKSLKRFVGANIKEATKFRLKRVADRKMSYFGMKKDPWDVYDKLKLVFQNSISKPYFFFLVADYGTFDKNLDPENKGFKKLIREIDTWANVGLHPSYASNQNVETLKKEKQRLENILGRPVTSSRQHYIKLSLPNTYRDLLSVGITDDYTMGFADNIGFRAGTSRSFYWYDLEREEQTKLKIHPFCAMDVTFKNYLRYEPSHAEFDLVNLRNAVKQVDGTFSIICHNESLSGYAEWKQWDEVFMEFISS